MHIPTILMAVVLVSATLALAVGLVAERGQRDGMYLWAAALAVQTLAYVLLSSHGGMPIGPSLVAAGVLMSVSLALSSEALCQFHMRRPRRWLLWGPVPAALLCFALLLHNPPARMLVAPVIFSVQIVILLNLQQRARAKTVGRGQYFVFAALVLLLLVLASRFIAALQGTAALADFGALSPTQMLTFVGVLVSTVLASFGWVLMGKERADYRSRQMAMFDELTGLASRRSTLQVLGQQVAMAHRSGQPLTVLMLDIDHFKRVNDEYGHLVGDAALRHVAHALKARLRGQDMLGRFGGEEFLAILPATEAADGGLRLAENVRAAVSGAPMLAGNGRAIEMSVSIGVAQVEAGAATDAQTVVRAADMAMYRAKTSGRNHVRLADPADYGSVCTERG